MPTDTQSKALQLVNHTRDLYAAILRARSETSGLVLKDMGDAIYDAIAWEDLATPVKQALVIITRELLDANTQNAIRDIEAEAAADAQTSIVYERPNKEKADRHGETKLEKYIDEAEFTQPKGGAFTRFGSDEIENEESESEAPARTTYHGGKVDVIAPTVEASAPDHSEIRESPQETIVDVEIIDKETANREFGKFAHFPDKTEAETEPTEENTRPQT